MEMIRKAAVTALALIMILGTAALGQPAAVRAYGEDADPGPILYNPPPIWGLDFETYTADSYPLQVMNGPLNLYVMTKGTAVAQLKLKVGDGEAHGRIGMRTQPGRDKPVLAKSTLIIMRRKCAGVMAVGITDRDREFLTDLEVGRG